MQYAIGIDLGGTAIKSGLVDEKGNILFEDSRPTRFTASSTSSLPSYTSSPPSYTSSPPSCANNSVLENIKVAVTRALEKAKTLGHRVKGIGIGAPGIIDEGCVTACGGNLPEVEGMALGRLIEDSTGLPCRLENDANLMGLAEARYGAARGMQEVIFLTVGTGIGGALVVRGQLYSGFQNKGGELGHILVSSTGRPCTCGARGCLEAQASIPALLEDYRQLTTSKQSSSAPSFVNPSSSPSFPSSSLDGRRIVALYQEGDPAALAAMDLHFDYLATGIGSLINIFSPQKIIIGGGISESGDFYIREIRHRALRRAMKETSANTSIEAAMLGNKAGFLGAAALIFDKC